MEDVPFVQDSSVQELRTAFFECQFQKEGEKDKLSERNSRSLFKIPTFSKQISSSAFPSENVFAVCTLGKWCLLEAFPLRHEGHANQEHSSLNSEQAGDGSVSTVSGESRLRCLLALRRQFPNSLL